MRDIVIAGNWKMNTDMQSGAALAGAVRDGLLHAPLAGVRVVVCPPFIVLDTVRGILAGSTIGLGAQNVSEHADGAVTGEVSATMLRSAGCTHVIVGHSERRAGYHETDAVINAKVRRALAHDLHPIICVGETLDERNAGVTARVIDTQVRGVLASLTPDDLSRCIIAYEPVWAIGTGVVATPAQAQEVHAQIRALVVELYGAATAEAMIILYGGSMKPDNAAELLAETDVDGGLIGGASLAAPAFLDIVAAAQRLRAGA